MIGILVVTTYHRPRRFCFVSHSSYPGLKAVRTGNHLPCHVKMLGIKHLHWQEARALTTVPAGYIRNDMAIVTNLRTHYTVEPQHQRPSDVNWPVVRAGLAILLLSF